MTLLMFSVLILIAIQVALPTVFGNSPPVKPPPPATCQPTEELCNRYSCYLPETHNCLKYNDGSGGVVCQKGDTFCGGQCLTPASGKVCVQKPGQKAGSAYEEICNPGEQLCGIGYCYNPEIHDCVQENFICLKGKSYCGRSCYTPSPEVECVVGETGWGFVCKPWEKVCGSAGCYDDKISSCNEFFENIVPI